MLRDTKKVTVTIPYKNVQGWREVQRIQGTCDCGRVITVEYDDGNGFDCECGKIYNLSGQELRPRHEWEERIEEDY